MYLQYFFERLKFERELLGFTQDEMVVKTGVSKRSYCAYEAGDTAPSAKLLAALVMAGIDVPYLLTGQRSQPIESSLTRREQSLLANYGASDEAGKKIIEGTALLAAKPKDVKGSKAA
jgi:transcriptional regulator with XRE-family HTH domain